MPPDEDGRTSLPAGLGRTFATAKLTAALGMRMARRVYGGKARRDDAGDAADTAEAVRKAEALVAKLGGLKGLVMKAGQIASYMPGAMPPQAQAVLARLQSSVEPMAFPAIAAQLEAELGGPPEALFDDFERKPFAAASIGQVHRARLRGAPVAVKVQYPGIEALVRKDVQAIRLLAGVSFAITEIDSAAVFEELRDRVLEECDYTREAANQEIFTRLLAELPDCRVPAVLSDRSSRRVLTTALCGGAGFYDFCASADQPTRDRAGQAIFRACFDTLFRRCIYNCDPHPGNYLFEPDGDVWFLDFGCVRRFRPEMVVIWKRMAHAILAGDRRRWREAFLELGFVPKPSKFDWDFQWQLFLHLYRPFLEPGFRYHHEFVREGMGPMLFDNPNRNRIAMPREWIFLNRIQWGLNSVLAHLGAGGPWGEWFRAAVASPEQPA